VQTQVIVESLAHLINLLKSSSIGSHRYEKVVSVGFSIGAIASVSLAKQQPEAIDAMVLHGYSWDATDIYPAFLSGLQVPVKTLERPDWKNLPATYSSQSTPAAREVAVFFDHEVAGLDYEMRGKDALGLAMSFTYHIVSAKEYTGPVFVGNGDRRSKVLLGELAYSNVDGTLTLYFAEDSTFCGKECGSKPYRVYDRLPKASDHEVKVYPNTGLGVLFHHCAQDLFVRVCFWILPRRSL
jgi:pimeloyl-ACP methyl ester carboxylesterase